MTIFPVPKPTREPRERKSLERKTWMQKENPERKAKRRAIQFGDAYAGWIQSLGCVVPGCRRTGIDPAHTVKRSRGLVRSTWRDIVPLCRRHHDEQEGRTAAFEADHGIDLALIAAAHAQRWMQFVK